MIFKGNGVIWNPDKGRMLVNFRAVESFETSDPREIELLSQATGIVILGGSDVRAEGPIGELTKGELVIKAKARGITGADRLSKTALVEKLKLG